METVVFDYNGFCEDKHSFPCFFDCFSSTDRSALVLLQNEYDKNDKKVSLALDKLKERTTSDYFLGIYAAQTKALDYAKKVFPTYKFILPEDLADDWLSVVGWHKKHPARDHSLHQPLTAYIVQKILGFGNAVDSLDLPDVKEGNLLDYCTEQLCNGAKCGYLRNYMEDLYPRFAELQPEEKKQWAKKVFYEASVISALFHDMGYPWQYVNSLAGKVEAAEYKDFLDKSFRSQSVYEIIKDRLLIFPFYGYNESNVNRPVSFWKQKIKEIIDNALINTHGFPGAVAFTILNDKIRKFPSDLNFNDATYRFILDWAAVGIMMHDMPKIYFSRKDNNTLPQNSFLRLSFDVDPLSSLVSMADILEEFHRPKAKFCHHNSDKEQDKDFEHVKIEYEFPCVETSVTIKNKVFVVTYKYEDEINRFVEDEGRNKEIDEYFNNKDGFVNLSSIGVQNHLCTTKTEKG